MSPSASTPSAPALGNLDRDAVKSAYDSVQALIAEIMDLADPVVGEAGVVNSTWSPAEHGSTAADALYSLHRRVGTLRGHAAQAEVQIVRAAGSADPSTPRDLVGDEEPLSEADVLAQGTLDALRIADAAFTHSPVDHELPGRVDGQLHLDQAMRLAQKLHHLAFHLPYIVQALRTVRGLDDSPVAPAGLAETEQAAISLYQSSERLMRDLDPNYGPHRPADADI